MAKQKTKNEEERSGEKLYLQHGAYGTWSGPDEGDATTLVRRTPFHRIHKLCQE